MSDDSSPETIAAILDDVRDAIEAPTMLVTMRLARRHFLLAGSSASGPPSLDHAFPIDHALCKDAVEAGTELVINDARAHVDFRSHVAVTDHGVAAYLGVPIYIGREMSTVVCALDTAARQWTRHDIEAVRGAAKRSAKALYLNIDERDPALPVVTT